MLYFQCFLKLVAIVNSKTLKLKKLAHSNNETKQHGKNTTKISLMYLSKFSQ